MDVNGNLFFTRKDGGALFCSHLPVQMEKPLHGLQIQDKAHLILLTGTGSVAGSTSVTTTLAVAVLLELVPVPIAEHRLQT